MKNDEIICRWMEPTLSKNSGKWMLWTGFNFLPRHLSLDALHEVEAKLTDEQWTEYRGWFMVEHSMAGHKVPLGSYLLHVTAEQKITALAAVLKESDS